MPKALRPEKVNQILDRATEGGSLKKIANETGVDSSTVWAILGEFPLWAWVRNSAKEH